MSALVLCGACQVGDHDNHDGEHHGLPGVLGGHQCPCAGDCKPLTWVDLWGMDPDYPPTEADATAARIAELEAQLAAARSALAACREVAGKRAGDDA